MYLDDAVGFDYTPINHVDALFFTRLRVYKLKPCPEKYRFLTTRIDFLGHVISSDGVQPNDDKVVALTRIPMSIGTKQLWSLLGDLSYYHKFLHNMAKRIRPVMTLL